MTGQQPDIRTIIMSFNHHNCFRDKRFELIQFASWSFSDVYNISNRSLAAVLCRQFSSRILTIRCLRKSTYYLLLLLINISLQHSSTVASFAEIANMDSIDWTGAFLTFVVNLFLVGLAVFLFIFFMVAALGIVLATETGRTAFFDRLISIDDDEDYIIPCWRGKGQGLSKSEDKNSEHNTFIELIRGSCIPKLAIFDLMIW